MPQSAELAFTGEACGNGGGGAGGGGAGWGGAKNNEVQLPQ
jgi:hypothetical protein